MSHDYFIGVDALGAEPGSIDKPDPKAVDAGDKAIKAGNKLKKKLPKIAGKLIAAGNKLKAKASKAAIASKNKATAQKKADAAKAKSKVAKPTTAPVAATSKAAKTDPFAADFGAKSSVAVPKSSVPMSAASSVAVPTPVTAPLAATTRVATPSPAPAPVQTATTRVVAPAPAPAPRAAVVAPSRTTAPSRAATRVRGLEGFQLQAAANLDGESQALYAYTDMAWALEPVVDLRDKLDAARLTTIADQGQDLLVRGDAIDVTSQFSDEAGRDIGFNTSGISEAKAIAREARAWLPSAQRALANAPAPGTEPSPEDLLNQGVDPYAGGGGGGGGFDFDAGGGGDEDPFAGEGSDFDPNAAMDAATEGGEAPMPEGFEQDFSDGGAAEEPAVDPLLEQEFLEAQAQGGVDPDAAVEETEPKPITFKSPFKKVSDEKWTEFVNAMRTAELGDVSDSNALGAFEMKMRRLGDLGLVKNLRCVRSPDTNRLIWEGDFVAPMTAKRFLSDPDAQYKAFSDSMRAYRKSIKNGEVPWPQGGLVDGTTFSGVLAILHRAGPKGIANFSSPESRFPETEELYKKANGIF